MAGGRPSLYNDELAKKVCALIADGHSLRTIAAMDGLPCKETITNWCLNKPEFLIQYVRAKEEQAEAFAEELLDIADDARNDWMENNAPGNVGWQANGEHIQRSRLRIDARKWLMGKMKPKKYGDKQHIEVEDVTSVAEKMKERRNRAKPETE
jgi:hypothetical protein